MSRLQLLLVTILAAGAALGLFAATSQEFPLLTISPPICAKVEFVAPGFNLWTGQPHGQQVICWDRDAAGNLTHRTVLGGDPGPFAAGRWAIPLPLGFAIGFAVAGGVVFLLNRRGRVPA